jgi:MFS family permease
MFLWLIYARSIWMFYLFAAIFGFAYGGWIPQSIGLLGDYFGRMNLGSISGITMFGSGVGSAMGIFLAGYIFDVTGAYTLSFLGGAAIFGASTLLILFIKKPEKA